ncbi:MAG TPA: hypothetical protein VF190_10655 [Rhodothermales bacterium]
MSKPFTHYVRRTHLYLALFVMPWFVMYGISSLAFSHPGFFESGPDLYDPNSGAWKLEGEWPCSLAVPEGEEIPREFAARLLATAGVESNAFGTYRASDTRIEVHDIAFWRASRLTYVVDEQRLVHESRKMYPQHFLTGMHARAGFQHAGFLNDAWAVMVDVSAIGFVLWVLTGLIVWWQLPKMRSWGIAGLVAGILSFVLLLVAL